MSVDKVDFAVLWLFVTLSIMVEPGQGLVP
ncbi:hypothetical protein EDE12_110105 [Methylosinus sp. sav-2]|jgi:hypothetical protein|nr:hypothetical protein EDE12_110105 [Methylosinus sp. sav-2]